MTLPMVGHGHIKVSLNRPFYPLNAKKRRIIGGNYRLSVALLVYSALTASRATWTSLTAVNGSSRYRLLFLTMVSPSSSRVITGRVMTTPFSISQSSNLKLLMLQSLHGLLLKVSTFPGSLVGSRDSRYSRFHRCNGRGGIVPVSAMPRSRWRRTQPRLRDS